MQNNQDKGLIIGIVIVTILIFAGLIWAITVAGPSTPSGSNGQEEKVRFTDTQYDPFIGPEDAKLVVHMYGDFQCPACRLAEPPLRAAMEKYKDRVKFVWKDFPLYQIHKNAMAAANAARCAQTQEKFWEYHDKLYSTQNDWSNEADPSAKFVEYAGALGLNEPSGSTDAFRSCLQSRPWIGAVQDGLNEGNANRVNATPTFFIGNRRYFAMSVEQWSEAIDRALTEAKP